MTASRNNNFVLKLPSEPSSIGTVESFVKDLVSRFDIQQEKYPNILISLTEAVNNAIIHGNNHDQQKFVNIRLNKSENILSFRVSDEGNGFNHFDLPDPTAPENIECCGGRGVFLIKHLCDRVLFYNNGSTVEMQFHL